MAEMLMMNQDLMAMMLHASISHLDQTRNLLISINHVSSFSSNGVSKPF